MPRDAGIIGIGMSGIGMPGNAMPAKNITFNFRTASRKRHHRPRDAVMAQVFCLIRCVCPDDRADFRADWWPVATGH
jgi:hypothetical protein